MRTSHILFSVRAGGYARWPATTCYEASPGLSNAHSFANSDSLTLIHETRCISTKVACECHENGSWARFLFKLARSLTTRPTAFCRSARVRTIHRQANLNNKKTCDDDTFHLSLSCHRLEFRHAGSKKCVSTFSHYPITKSPLTHTKNMQEPNQPGTGYGCQVWSMIYQKNG
jgi:hypothetical protein